MSALTPAIDPEKTVGNLKHRQDYGSVPSLSLTGASFLAQMRERAHFNKITISVVTLHGLRIREAIPSLISMGALQA
jgi:hypothetical protein